MKTFLLLCSAAALAQATPAAASDSGADIRIPPFVTQSAYRADYVTISVYDGKKKEIEKPLIRITDRTWIEQMAKVLTTASYRPVTPLLASAPPISFFDKSGKKLLDLVVIGRFFCLNGRTYQVSSSTLAAVSDLVRMKKANQSTDPTPPSVTPPAEQPTRQP